MSGPRLASVVFLLLAIIAGAALLLQRQTGNVLREQIALLRAEQRNLAALRAENARLKARQPSEAELDSLRGDHAAMERLRTELNALRSQISAEESALVRPAN